MTIRRIAGAAKGRARAAAYNDVVFSVATAQSTTSSVGEQTRLALAALEKNLIDAGSDKTRILSATVYLADIATKEEMDDVWREWIGGPENWPQRACVGAALAGTDLVEIVVQAAAEAPIPGPTT